MATAPTTEPIADHQGSRGAHLLWLGLAGVLLAGLLPRLYALSERSLWFDEAFCWRLIQFPFFDMLERVGRDNHPPLYFILLKLWAALFGDSAAALRSLSVVCGLAAIAGTYLFAAAAFQLDCGADIGLLLPRFRLPRSQTPFGNEPPGNSVSHARAFGLFSAALVALSGLQIRYSWEMRMYALTAALAVFSSWALVRALHAPDSRRRWLLYGCLALLLAYSHYYGLFTLASQGVFAALFLWRQAGWRLTTLCRRPHFWYALLTAALVLLAWAPWLAVFLRQRAQVKAAFWSGPVSLWDVAELCYQMFLQPEYLPRRSQQLLLWALVVCAAAVYLLARKAGPRDWLVLCLGLGPLACCLLASAWDVPVFTLRYFVPAHVFLLVGLAALVWRIRYRAERAIAAALVLALFAGVDFDLYQTMDLDNKPGSRGAAAFLAQERRPGEPVVAAMPFFFFSLLHYAPDRSAYYIYTGGTPMPHYYGTAAMTAADLIDARALKALRSRRVWVVDLAGGFLGYHAVPVPPTWVEKRQRVFADVFNLGNLIVAEYDTGPD